MANRLVGKIAIVTCGSSGIGAAAARLFLQEGASVMIADLRPPVDERLVAAIGQFPDRAASTLLDVTDEKQMRMAIAETVTRWGGLNVDVASAGLSINKAIVDTTELSWDRTMSVNAKGVFFLTKHSVPEMLKAGGGSIINLSSIFAMLGAPGNAAYCASKGAVRSLTKATAIEHVRQGIRANSIHPGVIETPGLQGVIDQASNPTAMRHAIEGQQPNGFTHMPDDVGWACVYLASDEFRFVSGAELVIDHGMLVG